MPRDGEFQHKPNSGSLFRNSDKEQGNPEQENWADHKGSALIDGKEYWVSAWINTSKKGTRYFGLRFESKDDAHNKGTAQARKAATSQGSEWDDFDDDIPF